MELRVVVDQARCVGNGICTELAEATFQMDAHQRARVVRAGTQDPQRILDAARACPTSAIQVIDRASGRRLFP